MTTKLRKRDFVLEETEMNASSNVAELYSRRTLMAFVNVCIRIVRVLHIEHAWSLQIL